MLIQLVETKQLILQQKKKCKPLHSSHPGTLTVLIFLMQLIAIISYI